MTKTPNDARATLESVDEALRRADDLHWSDPEFLEWERDLVGPRIVNEIVIVNDGERLSYDEERVRVYRYGPGPTYPRHPDGLGCYNNHVRAMISYAPVNGGDVFYSIPSDSNPRITEPDPVFGHRLRKECIDGPLYEDDDEDDEEEEEAPNWEVEAAEALQRMRANVDRHIARAQERDQAWINSTRTVRVTGVAFDYQIGTAPQRAYRRPVEEMRQAVDAHMQEFRRAVSSMFGPAAAPHTAQDTNQTPRERALNHRRAHQAWHAFTDRPQNQPRRRSRTGPPPLDLTGHLAPRRVGRRP